MANDNKISIDIEISGNGKNQVEGITAAFDKLRNSVNGLSSPLNDISKNINSLDNNLSKYNDSISKAIDQNKELAKTGGETSNKVSDLVNSFATWSGIIESVKLGLTGMEAALTGGLAIITTFAPEIIKFVAALFKGKDAVDQAKMSLDSLNKGITSTSYSNAIENVDSLRIKVDLAKKGFISKSEVVKEYNKTLGETIGQVKTLNQVETLLKNNAKDYIQMMLYKASAMAAIKEAADNQVLAQKEINKSDEESSDWLDSGLANSKDPTFLKIYQDNALKNRKEAAKPFQEKAHTAQSIAEHFFELAAKIEQNSPINKLRKQIEDLEKLSNAKVIGSATFKQIQKLKTELKSLDPTYSDDENIIKKNDRPKKIKLKHEQTHPAVEALQVKADGFAKIIELDKLHYDAEQVLLDDRLDKKLISQQEYQEQSHQLEEKYHVGIGEKIKRFNKEELAATQKQQQDLVAAQQHQEVMAADEHAVKKAVLPADKLAAEKQLIMDKYDFEVQQAAAAGKDTTEIRKQYEEETTALTKRYEEERKAFALQTAQKVSDTAFNILKGSIQSQADAKIKGLETQKQAELSNSNLTADQKRAIEDKYKKKEAEEKVKAFKAEQKASILQAVINGALAITKATSQTGVLAPFVIPGIIVETAIQVATIAKQKAPQYAKGGLHYHSDGRGALLSGYSRTDDTNAYLRSGEAVVVSEAMRNPWARNLVSAINVAHGGRDFSVSNPGRGYAIGGVFTDGGNANRYYSQPANDAKDLANTLAYQMINNFPPIYVDVKDVNNQQNILAQTVNRVNL